jgi:hypothetical protein
LKKTTEDGKISHACGLAESTEYKWLHYQKQSKCFDAILIKILVKFKTEWKIYPNTCLETQKSTNNQGKTEQ